MKNVIFLWITFSVMYWCRLFLLSCLHQTTKVSTRLLETILYLFKDTLGSDFFYPCAFKANVWQWTELMALNEVSLTSDEFTLFIAPTDVHEQLPHQLAWHLVKRSSLRGDNGVLGSIISPHFKAHSILGEERNWKSRGGFFSGTVGRPQLHLSHAQMHKTDALLFMHIHPRAQKKPTQTQLSSPRRWLQRRGWAPIWFTSDTLMLTICS